MNGGGKKKTIFTIIIRIAKCNSKFSKCHKKNIEKIKRLSM